MTTTGQTADASALSPDLAGRPGSGLASMNVADVLTPLFDRMPLGVAVFDRALRLVHCNATWADFIVRYTTTSREAIAPGVPFFELAPGTEEAVEPLLRRVLAGESVREDAMHLVSTGGIDSWWDFVLAPMVVEDDVLGLVDLVTDATDRVLAHRHLEQQVVERTRELQMLLDMSRSIALMSELEPLLEVIFDQMRQFVDYEAVAIGLADGNEYTIAAVRRDEIGRRSRDPLGVKFAIDRGQFLWQELAAGRTLYTADVDGDDDVARGFRQLVGDRLQTTYAHVRSLLAAPLIVSNELIGAMFISSAEVDRYRPHDIDLVAAVANQVAVAVANARLHEQARTMAALEERQKLARELHDSVSQALYGIALGARTARMLLDRDPTKVAEPLDYVVSLAEAGLTEMRALIFELRPDALETEGLATLLEKQATALRIRHGLAVEFELGPEPDAPLVVKEMLYRIAQEAMHNAVKHARADRLTLRLAQTPEAIALEVADNGIGFDPDGRFPGHLGLRSMRERAARHGGILELVSAPGKGTRVRVRVPLAL